MISWVTLMGYSEQLDTAHCVKLLHWLQSEGHSLRDFLPLPEPGLLHFEPREASVHLLKDKNMRWSSRIRTPQHLHRLTTIWGKMVVSHTVIEQKGHSLMLPYLTDILNLQHICCKGVQINGSRNCFWFSKICSLIILSRVCASLS